ncbi:hypothetical protein D3C75_1150930 [compost metagenome]
MLVQNFGSEAYSLFRSDTAIRPNFHRQLVVVGHLTDTSVVDAVIHTGDRRIDGIHRNNPDGLIVTLVTVRLDVTAATACKNSHVKSRARSQRCNMKIRVQDLNIAVRTDITCGNDAFTFSINLEHFLFV